MNKNEDKKEVYTQIEKDVLLLQESMNILHNVVQTQQDDIDTIEDMIQHTKQECKQGSTDLVISTETQQQTNYINYIAGGLFTLFIYILL
jgi:t-SNARE complex subunit (syntaxin)